VKILNCVTTSVCVVFLKKVLRTRGVRNLVLTGVTTDVCVHTTMRNANDMGYECVLLEVRAKRQRAKMAETYLKVQSIVQNCHTLSSTVLPISGQILPE